MIGINDPFALLMLAMTVSRSYRVAAHKKGLRTRVTENITPERDRRGSNI